MLMCCLLPSILLAQGINTIKFDDADYIYRWSKGNQYEFTPVDQPNLKKWQDMLTIVYYPQAKDGNSLAEVANNVLGSYQKHAVKILRTASKPRLKNRPAEHFVAAVFARPQFVEFVQARFKINGGVGVAIIYSHRIYGKKAGNPAHKWIKTNGPGLEKKLMSLKHIPKLSDLQKLAINQHK